MASDQADGSASIGEGRDLAQKGKVSGVGQVAALPFKQAVETLVGIREDVGGEWNTFPSEARGSLGHNQALRRFLTRSQGGQSGIDDIAAGQAKCLEAGSPEADLDPASDGGLSRHRSSCLGTHASGARMSPGPAVGPKPLSNR